MWEGLQQINMNYECSEDEAQNNCHCRTSLQRLKYNQLLLYNSKTGLLKIMPRDFCINITLIFNSGSLSVLWANTHCGNTVCIHKMADDQSTSLNC